MDTSLPAGPNTCVPNEYPVRHPNSINIPWPEDLHFRRGSPGFLHKIRVYYDFDWRSVFRHNRSQFRHGKSLAKLAERFCPPNKTPALLLTTRPDAEEKEVESGDYFILVVDIHRYLRESSGDAATDYFAGRLKGNITKGGHVTGLRDPLSPELIESIIENHLDLDAIARWARDHSDGIEQLKKIFPEAVKPLSIREIIEGLQSLDHVDEKHVNAILEVLQEIGVAGFSNILEWVVEFDEVAKHLTRLDVNIREQLNSLTGITRLKETLAYWEANKDKSDEAFWQKTLQNNSFVLSQVLPSAVIILKGQPYMGGKGIENVGGNFADFLCRNSLTRNAFVVEIKTPTTSLLTANPYRSDVYNVHPQLSGAVMQVLNDKHSLTKEYCNLVENSTDHFEAFDPQCLVIAGSTTQLDDRKKVKSFELFRNGLKDVQVTTYDELFKKIEVLVKLLEGNAEQNDGSELVSPLATCLGTEFK